MSNIHSNLTPVTDVPVDVPAGSKAGPAHHASPHASGETSAPNTPYSSSSSHSRIGVRQLEQLSRHLSGRDRLVLADLATHGYLSTGHIAALRFRANSPSTRDRLSRRVVTRLHRLGLIQPLSRRVGGVRGGSSARIWQLSSAGRRLIARDELARRPHEPSPRLLTHALAVADTRVAIEGVATDGTHIVSATVTVEYDAWRRYTGLGGDRRLLQPDLAAHLHGHDKDGDYDDHWFVEVDAGTESIPTLLRKCDQYEDYRRSGIEQDKHDIFPRVLWVFYGARAERRRDQLTAKLARGDYPHGMFVLTVSTDLVTVVGGAV